MTGITQCKECKEIFKFSIISDDVPKLCPKCEKNK